MRVCGRVGACVVSGCGFFFLKKKCFFHFQEFKSFRKFKK